MKNRTNIFSFLFVSLIYANLFSQSITLTPYKMNSKGNPKDFLLDSLIVTNTSNQDIYIFINRLAKNIPQGWASCFCHPTCIVPWRDTLTWKIPANSSCSVSPNFNTDSIPDFGTIIVEIYQIGFASSADTVTFTGSTLGTGITESFMNNISIYPNPTVNSVSIENSGNEIFFLKIMNEAGEKISSHNYSEKKINLSFSKLPSGYYFLNFKFENGSVGTRKILKAY